MLNHIQAATPAKLERICVLPSGKLVEVTPGVRYAAAPKELTPRFAIVRLVPAGDGTYRPTLEIHDHWLRITEAARMLGVGEQSLSRLADGNFIESRHFTPKNLQINLESFLRHCRAVQEDPDFWQKTENKKRFALALSRNS